MRTVAHFHDGGTAGSRIDRIALRIHKRSMRRLSAPESAVGAGSGADADGPLSRRKVLARALGASALVMLPLRLANPSTARAEGYCAAACLNDATAAQMARFHQLNMRAFGADFASPKDFNVYVASKIRAGGLGALLIVTEILQADRDIVASEIRYYYDAGRCGGPNCGNPKKYPPPATGACTDCRAGSHCCVCRDYNDGKPLPNVLVNGGYSCATYCTTLGFTVISDTPC